MGKTAIIVGGLALMAMPAFSANKIMPGRECALSKREPLVFAAYKPYEKKAKPIPGIPGFFTFFYNEPRKNEQDEGAGYKPMPRREGNPGGFKIKQDIVPQPSEKKAPRKKFGYEHERCYQQTHQFPKHGMP